MSRVVPAAVVAALALATAGSATAAAPQAHAAGGCHLSSYEQRHMGATYVTSLSVRHTSCSTGKAVVRAFNKCRKGPRGHCHHRVKHFKCSERRSGISVQFNSTVNCTRGSRRVHFTYTQNT